MPTTTGAPPINSGRLPGHKHPSLHMTTADGEVIVLARFVDDRARRLYEAHGPRFNVSRLDPDQLPAAPADEGDS